MGGRNVELVEAEYRLRRPGLGGQLEADGAARRVGGPDWVPSAAGGGGGGGRQAGHGGTTAYKSAAADAAEGSPPA